MPRLSRWFVRAALVALLAGLGRGALVASGGRAPFLDPTGLHLLVVGWLTQMVFGVAFWLFPRFAPGRPRGYPWLGWLTFVALNAGLLLRVLAEPLPGFPARATVLLWSGVLQAGASIGFVVNTWPRIRERP